MGLKQSIYVTVLYAHWWRTTLEFGFCDIYDGPVQTVCKNATREWKSCVTNSYVESFFHGHLTCVTEYCSLTCMQEKHGKPLCKSRLYFNLFIIICLSVCLSVCLCVFPSTYPPKSRSVAYLSTYYLRTAKPPNQPTLLPTPLYLPTYICVCLPSYILTTCVSVCV